MLSFHCLVPAGAAGAGVAVLQGEQQRCHLPGQRLLSGSASHPSPGRVFPPSRPTARAVARYSLLRAVRHLEHGPVPGGAVHRKVPHPPTRCQGAGSHIWPAHGRWGGRRATQHLATAETPRTPHQRYGLSLRLPPWSGRGPHRGCLARDNSCFPSSPTGHQLSAGRANCGQQALCGPESLGTAL